MFMEVPFFPKTHEGLTAHDIDTLYLLRPLMPEGVVVGTATGLGDDEKEVFNIAGRVDGAPTVLAAITRLSGAIALMCYHPDPLGGPSGRFETIEEVARAVRLYYGADTRPNADANVTP